MDIIEIDEIVNNPKKYFNKIIRLKGYFKNGYLTHKNNNLIIDENLLYIFNNDQLCNHNDEVVLECVADFGLGNKIIVVNIFVVIIEKDGVKKELFVSEMGIPIKIIDFYNNSPLIVSDIINKPMNYIYKIISVKGYYVGGYFYSSQDKKNKIYINNEIRYLFDIYPVSNCKEELILECRISLDDAKNLFIFDIFTFVFKKNGNLKKISRHDISMPKDVKQHVYDKIEKVELFKIDDVDNYIRLLNNHFIYVEGYYSNELLCNFDRYRHFCVNSSFSGSDPTIKYTLKKMHKENYEGRMRIVGKIFWGGNMVGFIKRFDYIVKLELIDENGQIIDSFINRKIQMPKPLAGKI